MSSIFIQSAGLVIVSPYLNTLFSRLGYLEEGAFKSKEYQFRAVQLLAYMAVGREILEEHELVFQKLLCGLDLEEPIDTSIELTVEEKETAHSLLLAIIQQWTTLNNTTIESLRISFLQRDGKLEEDSDAFFLQVEQKAFDVLLDTIPWSFSKIEMSWIEKTINVTWRN